MNPPNRIEQLFRDRRVAETGALLPYLTSGFPDVDTVAKIIRKVDALGATVVELGIPYSDSIADGPVIQASFHEALAGGLTLEDTFCMVEGIRDSVGCALVAMGSFSIVHRYGLEAFMSRARGCGFDGVIIPDVPLEESAPVSNSASGAGLCHIGLVAPTTSPKRCAQIVKSSTGFVYRIAVSGTTGERSTLPAELAGDVADLRRMSGLPVCVGFGVSTADQVRQVCASADGAIVGSAIVRRVFDAKARGQSSDAIADSVGQFVAELMAGVSSGSR